MENEYYPFVNLPLPYAYDALEPYIDEKTMRLHHDKHLQTYIDNLNGILEDNFCLRRLSLEQLIIRSCRMPRELGDKLRNNAGGVYNHRFYFDLLANPAPDAPSGALAIAINRQFDGFDNFKQEFKKAALSVFGSGYAWLVCQGGRLKIVTTANQNNPLEANQCPILTIDVWEHAYYLKHYNVRAAYIDDWFCVVDWQKAGENYLRSLG